MRSKLDKYIQIDAYRLMLAAIKSKYPIKIDLKIEDFLFTEKDGTQGKIAMATLNVGGQIVVLKVNK